MSRPNPLRQLQYAARAATEYIVPGESAGRVVVFDTQGRKVLDVCVPACLPPSVEEQAAPAAGWVVTDRSAEFDGQPVPVRGRNLDVLRILAAGDVVTLEELRPAWGGYKAEDGTIRWQIGELRKTLKKTFGDFPGELIEATGAGYKLLCR